MLYGCEKWTIAKEKREEYRHSKCGAIEG